MIFISVLVSIASCLLTVISLLVIHKRHAHELQAKKEDEARVIEKWEMEEKKRKEHLPISHEETGQIICSCGIVCGTLHIHNLHVESKANLIKPTDASGWPERQFETVPIVKYAQRGVVAKNDIPNGMFTVITLKQGYDRKHVTTVIGSITKLTSSVSRIDLTARLVSVIAVNPSVWHDYQPIVSVPGDLFPFTEKKSKNGDRVLFPNVGSGDLILFSKALRADLPYELSRQFLEELGSGSIQDFSHTPSFAYMPEPMAAKDLTGFIDGTRNPDHLLRSIVDETLIFPDDNPNASIHQGGSYMYAGRFVHDLKVVSNMSKNERDNLIGRDYDIVCPHKGYDRRPENPHLSKPHPCAHIRRAYASMYRQAMPYVSGKEEGLYFICFSRHLSEIDESINRMCGYYDKEEYIDNIFKFTKSVTNGYYYVPSVDELQTLSEFGSYINSTVPQSVVTNQTNWTTMEQRVSDSLEKNGQTSKKVKIFIEHCVNCGYVSIFKEKKKVLEAIDPSIIVIGNPYFPRQSAFEVTMEDGTVLWSKLDQPDGRNNLPSVFPTNERLVRSVKGKLKLVCEDEDSTDPKTQELAVYSEFQTRVGIW